MGRGGEGKGGEGREERKKCDFLEPHSGADP